MRRAQFLWSIAAAAVAANVPFKSSRVVASQAQTDSGEKGVVRFSDETWKLRGSVYVRQAYGSVGDVTFPNIDHTLTPTQYNLVQRLSGRTREIWERRECERIASALARSVHTTRTKFPEIYGKVV